MGDPAGVGPEITAKALALPAVASTCRPVVIGSGDVMAATLELLHSPLALHRVKSPAECRFAAGTLECLDLENVDVPSLSRRAVSAEAGRAAYDYIESKGYAREFPHGTSHYLGLYVHDVGDLGRPLEPGMVITVEPGIYIEKEQLGVRIEDDIVITETGYRMLSDFPKEIAEIEALMARSSSSPRR